MNDSSRFMLRCLELARRGAGTASPNPQVGSVIVAADGRIIGEGFHAMYGGPHAEREALDRVSSEDQGALPTATLYVNLEPCSHHGKTPPCTTAIIESGVKSVVIGSRDTNPKVNGMTVLQDHGIQVDQGMDFEACYRANEAYYIHRTLGRPMVTLKIAQTIDGSMARPEGEERWITGPTSRQLVHQWRAEMDAVLVGTGTALIDNPELTVRDAEGPQPMRVILDRRGRLGSEAHLLNDEHTSSTVVFTGRDADPEYAPAFRESGGRIIPVEETDAKLDLAAILAELGAWERPVQSVLAEAGPTLARALLDADLVDRLAVFIHPSIMMQDVPTFRGDPGHEPLTRTFAASSWTTVGEGLLFEGLVRPVPELL